MLGLLVLIVIPIIVVCTLVSTIYVAPKKIIRNIEGDHINLICFNHKSDDIIITIDDIPYKNVKNLTEIVNILNENDVKATFFLIGSFVNESNEHVICDMIKAGHHIANHGMYDKRALTTDVNVLKQEIIECQMIIDELYKKSGVSQPQINYYRPGCGLFTKKIEGMVTELGYKIVLGSVFPFDPHVPISEINFLYIKLKLQPKDILILHDRSWTISLFKKIFEDPILITTKMTSFAVRDGELYICGALDEQSKDDPRSNSIVDYTISTETFCNLGVSTDVARVFCAEGYVMITDNNGALYARGDNRSGKLGINDTQYIRAFSKVELQFNVAQIACGLTRTMILDEEGDLYACGKNFLGELGLDKIKHTCTFVKAKLPFAVAQVACGEAFTMIVDEEGNLHTCGLNYFDHLERSENTYLRTFTKVNFPFAVDRVVCGRDHMIILDNRGNLYSCGGNCYGQLGLGDYDDRYEFVKVNVSVSVTQVVCGKNSTLILNEQGNLYVCGSNSKGQLGFGKTQYINTLTKITLPFDVVQIWCGSEHTMILDSQGNLHTCGKNKYGQLGLGDRDNRNQFTLVKNINVEFLPNSNPKVYRRIKSACAI